MEPDRVGTDAGRHLIRLVGLLAVAWLVMVGLHESGHLIGGWLAGATLVDFDLTPWRLPYSIHQPDPRPLLTIWSGPVFGVVAPYLLALGIRRSWAWFIADFCLLANGVYLAVAAWDGSPQLDTQRLLAAGASPASIAAFCIATIGTGYFRFRRDCMALFRQGSRR